MGDSIVTSTGITKLGFLLCTYVEEAYDSLVQATSEDDYSRLARTNAGVPLAWSGHLMDRQLFIRLEQLGLYFDPYSWLVYYGLYSIIAYSSRTQNSEYFLDFIFTFSNEFFWSIFIERSTTIL